ncbi:MAG TPA: flagellar assembly peptidoglycan hydrolase FlgJ [Rudaea sp.]|jgi:flagellar protein FlgJ|nr:flagellar assembly peptidoglycan hydrolase FlgJ [Rudaea sp.]
MSPAIAKLNANASDLPNSANLNSLRAAAAQKDPAAIDATARKFESLFAQQLVKTMRDASGSDAMFPGDSKTYRDLYDREVSNRLSQGRGLGMQAMIRKSLGGKPDATTSTSVSTAIPRTKTAAMSLAQYTRNLPPRHVASPMSTNIGNTSAVPAAPVTTTNTTSTPTNRTNATTAVAARGVPVTSVSNPTTLSQGSGRPSLATSDVAPTSSHGAPNRSISQEDFVTQVWPHAQRAAAALGVSPQALVAQAALESGWGKHVSGDNNLFGIKAGSSWTGATKSLSTSEVSNGQTHRETASFRSYASIGDSFDDYVKMLKTSPRYAAALGSGYDTQRFAGALQKAGYATDPNYASKISSIAHGSMIAAVLQKSGDGSLLASR